MLKFLSEFGPLIAFFVGYKFGGIQGATLYMIITAVVSISLCYFIEGKVQTFSLISTGVLLVSGSITLLTGNAMFIKIKPTILYIIFGSTFLISTLKGTPFIKYLFNKTLPLQDKAWNVISYNAAAFFYVMAIINDLVWRSYTEATWVKFKVFDVIPITLIFMLLHIPFVLRNKLPE